MVMKSKKKLELQLVKFKSIGIIYITPKKQLWGIFTNGVKKRIVGKIIGTTCLSEFIQDKKLISYKDSKLFKKGIQLVVKNVRFIVEVLSGEYLKKEFARLSNNSKKENIEIISKMKSSLIKLKTKNRCLGFIKSGLQCGCLADNDFCHKNSRIFNNKSPLRYPGGKTRACKILHKILSRNFNLKKLEFVVSPFFGGGSFEFFLYNKYGYKILANDIYYYLSNFWRVCKTNKEKNYVFYYKLLKILIKKLLLIIKKV